MTSTAADVMPVRTSGAWMSPCQATVVSRRHHRAASPRSAARSRCRYRNGTQNIRNSRRSYGTTTMNYKALTSLDSMVVSSGHDCDARHSCPFHPEKDGAGTVPAPSGHLRWWNRSTTANNSPDAPTVNPNPAQCHYLRWRSWRSWRSRREPGLRGFVRLSGSPCRRVRCNAAW